MKPPKRLFRNRQPRVADIFGRALAPYPKIHGKPPRSSGNACRQHSWILEDREGEFNDLRCRDCPAIAVACQWCFGNTRAQYPDYKEQGIAVVEECPRCRGKGIIEIVEITLAEVQRLRAKEDGP
jgi:hypothetical protein